MDITLEIWKKKGENNEDKRKTFFAFSMEKESLYKFHKKREILADLSWLQNSALNHASSLQAL